MRIRFLRPVIYETRGPRDGEAFEAGQIVDLRDDIAQRWLSRGVAERVPDQAKIHHQSRKSSLKGGQDA